MFSRISKALAGGLAGVLSALLADPTNANALHTLEMALVGYVVGHVLVYFAPPNKPRL